MLKQIKRIKENYTEEEKESDKLRNANRRKLLREKEPFEEKEAKKLQNKLSKQKKRDDKKAKIKQKLLVLSL